MFFPPYYGMSSNKSLCSELYQSEINKTPFYGSLTKPKGEKFKCASSYFSVTNQGQVGVTRHLFLPNRPKSSVKQLIQLMMHTKTFSQQSDFSTLLPFWLFTQTMSTFEIFKLFRRRKATQYYVYYITRVIMHVLLQVTNFCRLQIGMLTLRLMERLFDSLEGQKDF